jgi:hypothetical protein
MGSVALSSVTARQPAAGRAAKLVTIALAGLYGALMMYWTWRGVLGVPLELSVPVHMSDTGSPARPWAPWWVPTSIMAIIAMLLWRLLVARRDRVVVWRGMLVFILISLLDEPVAHLCSQIGAMMQFNPRPSIERILMILPIMLVGSVGLAVMMFMMGGFIALPVVALLGALNASIGKLICGSAAAAPPLSPDLPHKSRPALANRGGECHFQSMIPMDKPGLG